MLFWLVLQPELGNEASFDIGCLGCFGPADGVEQLLLEEVLAMKPDPFERLVPLLTLQPAETLADDHFELVTFEGVKEMLHNDIKYSIISMMRKKAQSPQEDEFAQYLDYVE